MATPNHKGKQRKHLQDRQAESIQPNSPPGEHGDVVAKEQGSRGAEILMKPLHRLVLTATSGLLMSTSKMRDF